MGSALEKSLGTGQILYFPDQTDCPARGNLWHAVNYKTAASNYYLGEIAYYTHNYQDAVAYYKLSASLYDQASYMDVLFLHTAIALDKSGEKEQARSFYQHVIDTYPNKKSAAVARNRI